MTLAYIQSEDRMVDVEAMLRDFKAMPPVSLEEGGRIVEEIQQEALLNGTAGMTMEEIDAEIAQCRKERREREALNADLCSKTSFNRVFMEELQSLHG